MTVRAAVDLASNVSSIRGINYSVKCKILCCFRRFIPRQVTVKLKKIQISECDLISIGPFELKSLL